MRIDIQKKHFVPAVLSERAKVCSTYKNSVGILELMYLTLDRDKKVSGSQAVG